MTDLEKDVLATINKAFNKSFTFKQLLNKLKDHHDLFINSTAIYAILKSLAKAKKINDEGDDNYSIMTSNALTKRSDYGILSTLISKIIIIAGKKIPLPSPKKMPKYLTLKAEAMWPEFWKKYGAQVRKVKDPQRRWATAVAIFRNYCLKRNTPIFKDSAAFMNQETSEYMKNRLTKNRDKLVNKTRIVLKNLKKSGVGTGILKERISEVYKNPKVKGYTIESVVPINLTKGSTLKSPEVKAYFKKFGFTSGRNRLVLSIGTHNLLLYPTSKDTRIELIKSLNFTMQHIKMMFAISDEDLKNEKFVKSVISKYYKTLLKANSTTKSILAVTAGRFSIDYDESLSLEDSESLSKLIDDIEDSESWGLNKIQSISNPVLQFNLVTKLKSKFGDEGLEVWDAILANPDDYLNPKNLKLEDSEITNDAEYDI